MNNMLTQEEIDALLDGVDGGSVATGQDVPPPEGDVQLYDITRSDKINRGRLPTLEMINDRFTRWMRQEVFDMLRKTGQCSVTDVNLVKYGDYLKSLSVPSNINLIKIKPLRGLALVVLEPKLVFALIDNFFGGDGRFHARIEGREFTPTEMRVILMLLERIFKAMVEAWNPVMSLEFEYMHSEINPQFANIVSPTETVVVSRFMVELDGGGGHIHLTMPYSMIEPIREQLDAGVQSDRVERDDRWIEVLREDVLDAEVVLRAMLGERQISVGELSTLRPGDVIPIDLPDLCTIMCEDVPIFRAVYGRTRTNMCFTYQEPAGKRELRTAGKKMESFLK